ncbi:hypothetical protein C8J56DRAFT_892769 [Mycena floridula]|nr:hypothetical protein C8J56DRAFT_892769 [Mycena floridula]
MEAMPLKALALIKESELGDGIMLDLPTSKWVRAEVGWGDGVYGELEGERNYANGATQAEVQMLGFPQSPNISAPLRATTQPNRSVELNLECLWIALIPFWFSCLMVGHGIFGLTRFKKQRS